MVRRWSLIVELEADTDTIAAARQALIDALEQATGQTPRTKTIETAALELALKPWPPVGKPPGQTTEPALLRRRHGKDTWQ
jgi:hypothetical protein